MIDAIYPRYIGNPNVFYCPSLRHRRAENCLEYGETGYYYWCYNSVEAGDHRLHLLKEYPQKKVIFTDFYGQPYIYYLFYSQYPPQKYQEQARLVENQFGDVGRVEKIDNVFFEPVERGKAENCRHCLVVFSQDEILRSGIDKDPQYFAKLKPLGEVGERAMFYAYGGNESK